MNVRSIGKTFPLSLSQQNILNLERTLAGTSVNNISTTIRITGRLDFPMLQKSINAVLESDPSLRTRLVADGEETVQYHAPYTKEDFPVYDFSGTSTEGVENWEIAFTRELIPLFEGPLYRFALFRDGESSGGVAVKLHHIIADGWSQVMLCNKISSTYIRLLEGKEPELAEAPSYELHVIEEQEYLNSKAFAKDEKYWESVLSQAGEPSVIKWTKGATVSPVGRRMSFELPQVINHAIYSYCLKNRVAPFAVFYMALAIYFKRNGGAQRFTIGVPIFNRTNYEFKQSSGMFVTTLPFCNEINDEWSLDRFNEELAERWFEMLRHQRYPFSMMSAFTEGEGRLFNIALSYQDSKIYESRDTSVMFSGRWHYCGYQAEQLTIHLTNLCCDSKYALDYDYLAQFFTEDEITSLHNNLCHILAEALSEPDRPIHRLNVLSLEQKEKLLYTFNQTERYLEERSVYEALISNNAHHRNRVALIHGGERMTYGALFHRATQFASKLSRLEADGEKLAAILLPRGFDLPASMVGCLQADYAYMVLSSELPTERIKTILEKSGAAALITDAKGAQRMSSLSLCTVCTDEVDLCDAVIYRDRDVNDDEDDVGKKLAYVVYTSGSTGEPKGVEITHENLLNLAQEMESVYGQGAVLSVCNVGFDAFMLESIVALLNGKTVVLPNDSELESPERLACLITGYAVGYFSMTPSRLSALLRSEPFRLAMRRMESIVCGGEHFPPELLKKLKTCTKARIYNQYGPSETTVAVSMKELSGTTDVITVGKPMGNCRLYVLDQWMNPLPIGGNGRLFVGGKNVGRGYRARPDLTEKAFRDNPFVTDDRIYDTGDLAYWTSRGEIMLTGRADRQIKLRGLRIELQEVSSCIGAYPGVTSAYAAVREISGQKLLGVYYTSDGEIADVDLLSHAATYLPEYMIPAFVMKVSALATNANGKVDEGRLPMPKISDGSACVNVSKTALALLDIFRKVLKNEKIFADSDYFLSGGNSLNALECVIMIEEAFGKKIRVTDLYACRNAVRLAELIGDQSVGYPSGAKSARSLRKAPKTYGYPLTPIQQGIYVQTALNPGGLSYNMPGAFMLEKEPDAERLSKAFETLIREDAIFRTVFVQNAEGVRAVVLDSVGFSLDTIEADTFEQACEAFLRPFDLSRAPLLRGALWQTPEGKYCLFIDTHHIVGDGMSTPIVLQRLDLAYSGRSCAPEWDYYDYVYTSGEEEDSEKKSSLDYWVKKLADMPESLTLPTDFVRQRKFDFKGSVHEHVFAERSSASITEYCREKGCSEYVLFLAAYALLISAVSGSDDFIIGTPVAGRNHTQSADICGPFINTLPLRLKPKKTLTVDEWIGSVQSEVTGMLDNQQAGLEDIISALDLPRSEMNALYKIMLTQSPVDEESFVLDGGKMTFRPVPTGAVKMDIITELAKKSSLYALRISYATSLFEEATVAFWARCIENILTEFIKKGTVALSDVQLMCRSDRETLIDGPNYCVTPFINRPIQHFMKQRSQETPNDTALIFHGERYSYTALEKRANRIARFIEESGVKQGQCVGLCLKRGFDMIASMYGILKAGCAYMFMLESFPVARITYMLEISQTALLIYDSAPEEIISGGAPCKVSTLPEGFDDEYCDRPVGDDTLVNVHFTSGSTGKPKGVMLRHRSIANLYGHMKRALEPFDTAFLCSTNSVFDCFLVETIMSMAIGKTVVLPDEEEMMLPWKLAQLMETYDTGIFEMTPSRLQMCFGNEAFCRAASVIRIILLGGEVLTPALVDKFHEHSPGILMNMYGPTETTIYTSMGHTRPGEPITIGKAFQNTRTYVCDNDHKPVLPTAVGELCIAGECMSLGYIGNPEATAKSFVEDAYFPGEKMYCSGDLVRLRIDGRYDYVARKDSQIKLNGQRVELTEINGAIERTEGVKQAATVPIKKDNDSMELCSFYVSEGNSVSSEKVVETISRLLPEYMIPSRIIGIASMPSTASNKIDMQALKRMATDPNFSSPVSAQAAPVPKEPEVLKAPEEVKEPETVKEPEVEKIPAAVKPARSEKKAEAENAPVQTELPLAFAEPESSIAEPKDVLPDSDYVLSAWNRVLTIPASSPEASFFKQGGTSMTALTVLSYYYNDGFEMSLTEFYEQPTAKGQAELLSKKRAAKKAPEGTPDGSHPIKEEKKRSSSKKSTATAPENERASVLVTGGTGFFGAHLVRELLEGGTPRVACLMRDGSRERLESTFEWYFGKERAAEYSSRTDIVKGDISERLLGMPEADYKELAGSLKEIYHSAADVRHYAADEEPYLATNVGGTENMLELARAAGAAFYHMSTCSVSGDRMKDGSTSAVFTEHDFDIGQIWGSNIYVKSKFLAEELVFAAQKEGLKVKIFRLGRLVGRADDGRFQINPETNAFYLFLKGFSQIGAIPEDAADIRLDLMPIDLAAREVLALKDAPQTVYHIVNHKPATFAEVLKALVSDCPVLNSVEFGRLFREKRLNMDRELLALVMNNFSVMGSQSRGISVSSVITENELKNVGFEIPDVSVGTVLKEFNF